MLVSSLDLLSTATGALRQRPMLDFHQGGHGTREEHEQVLRLRAQPGQPVEHLLGVRVRVRARARIRARARARARVVGVVRVVRVVRVRLRVRLRLRARARLADPKP